MALGEIGFRTAAAAVYTKNGASVVYATIHPASTVRCAIREIGIFNTTATSCAVGLTRVTGFGTVSTSETFQSVDVADNNTLQTVLDETWSVNPTTSNTPPIRRAMVPAAIGGGVIWVFGPNEFVCSSAGSFALVNMTGTGQILDIYVRIDE